MYISGVIATAVLVIGIPLIIWIYEPASCFDGVQNQGETAPDKGGPCTLLDERVVISQSILWARSFPAREGLYNAVAYVENPNPDAAVLRAPYRFRLYDDRNILIAERYGTTFIMPGTITPVFDGQIETGTRTVARTFFEFTEPLTWERAEDATIPLVVGNKNADETAARVTAQVRNTGTRDIFDALFVVVVFDTAGNALGSSRTTVPVIEADATHPLTFTWSEPFVYRISRTDILPIVEPKKR